MLIARIIYPIQTLGPGKRLVIWTVGCKKHCKNCANPELWEQDIEKDIKVEHLAEKVNYILKNYDVDGITITGGDPVEQSGELIKLLKMIRDNTGDILVYSGYTNDEIKDVLTNDEYAEFTSYIDVLIDGAYIDELNDGVSPLIGSTNQKIRYFNQYISKKYIEYLAVDRKIQNIHTDAGIISVGIHNKNNRR